VIFDKNNFFGPREEIGLSKNSEEKMRDRNKKKEVK
jgi:hypothetical protein